MGTRGAWGFRCKNDDKVTYCNWDSYLDGLGMSVLRFIKDCPNEELQNIALGIDLVTEQNIPTKEQIRDCKELGTMNLGVAGQTESDWYYLLSNTQGEPSFYKKGLRIMIDSNCFLADSLFCEWAYIINCDTNKLEIYKGFNRYANGNGRYAALKPKGKDYYGVSLLREITFEEIRQIDCFELCKQMAQKAYGKKNEKDE